MRIAYDIGGCITPFAEPAPLRLLVMPDVYRPYWHPMFTADGDFGRRVYVKDVDP